jgi:hypothetical protein
MRTRTRGVYGNATVSIQQDPQSPTMLVDYETAQNIFEDRNMRITGGRRSSRRQRRQRSTRRRRRSSSCTRKNLK